MTDQDSLSQISLGEFSALSPRRQGRLISQETVEFCPYALGDSRREEFCLGLLEGLIERLGLKGKEDLIRYLNGSGRA